MAKTYRRTIRINGKAVNSPRYLSKREADDWYAQMKAKKNHSKANLEIQIEQSEIPVVQELAIGFMNRRMAEHGANTYVNEESHLRHHVLPELGAIPANKVTPKKIEKVLANVTLANGSKASPSTKKKIKALISGLFEYALDEEIPGVTHNPVRLVRKNRRGVRESTAPKLPKKILSEEDMIAFLRASQEVKGVPGRAYAYASLMVMTGARVSEIIGLRWQDFDFINKTITFAWIYDRAGKKLVKRTKKGHDSERVIPMARELAEVMEWWRSQTPYGKASDFVLTNPAGSHMVHQTVRQMHDWICKKAGVEVNRHGLRHSFGANFALKTGNLKALQEILGHSSIQTTQIYAELNARHLQGFAKDMGLSASKVTPLRHHADTTTKKQQG
jgi:integrase